MAKKKHKAKMGRPPKPKDEKQGSRVMVNLTIAEWDRLAEEASAAGLSLSAYLVRCWYEKGAK
jgi:hypothetical protein